MALRVQSVLEPPYNPCCNIHMIRNIISFAFVFGACLSTFATVKNIQIVPGTASAFEQTAGSTSSAASTYTIFGGYTGAIGNCASPAGSSTCSSCTGATAPTFICTDGAVTKGTAFACAERSIFPSLLLGITMTVEGAPASPAIRVEAGSTAGTTITPDQTSTVPTQGTTTFTTYLKWSDLCQRAGLDINCVAATGGGGAIDLTVGLVDGSSSTFTSGTSQKFSLKIRYVDPTVDIDKGPTQDPLTTDSLTDFTVSPGDGKVFIDNLFRGSVGPNDSSSVKWSGIRVYYEQYVGTPTYCAIPINTAGYADLSFQSKTEIQTSLNESSLDGLTNDTQYMFTAAVVDETSIVSRFIKLAPATAQEITDYQTQYTAMPGEVVGLLDNKKCFIATAAYGSQMEPQVELLRQFRNRVLSKFSLGKQFIRFYYKNSPPLAAFIAEHDTLRSITRGLLWPIILFADISLQWGAWAAVAIYLAAFCLLITVIQRRRQGRRS
jgi:hypothetical protein